MYVDAYHNRETDEIWVIERVDGERRFVEYPVDYFTYYEDSYGDYKSIFGTSLKKVSAKTHKQFNKELKLLSGKTLFESDLNPIFVCLEEHYKGLPSPDLNVVFFDIEVGFDTERGFAPVEDPFSSITAISLYLNWVGKNITLCLYPETFTREQAEKELEGIEDTFIFDSEEELLKVFLDLIQDSDVLSGWNCLDKNSYVWLEDRIKNLGELESLGKTKFSGNILAYNDSGLKRKNILTTYNNIKLNVSDEHKIPVYEIKNKFTRPNVLRKSKQVLPVSEIKNKIKEGSNFAIEIPLGKNTNNELTYRNLLLQNVEWFLYHPKFNILINNSAIREEIWGRLDENRKDYFKEYDLKRLNQIKWSSNNLAEILEVSDIINLIELNDTIKVKLFNSKWIEIDLDQKIDRSLFQLLGFIFTDGTWDKCSNRWSYCNSDINLMNSYNQILSLPGFIDEDRRSDGCLYTVKYPSHPISLLALMVYDYNLNKKINVELLSQISLNQFWGFVSGLVDGDGSVTETGFGICDFKENSENLQQLFIWNGIYAISNSNYVSVPFHSNLTYDLSLFHTKKSKRYSYRNPRQLLNTPTNKFGYYVNDVSYLVAITSIEETDEYIDMADIMTENQHFECNGLKVHNSTKFDIPYIVGRILLVLGEDYARDLCLWDLKPRKRTFTQFKKDYITYEIYGRVHLDYLDLYMKHSMQELHTYRLDYVGEIEVDENKVPYEGTLDQLYKEDYRKFIEYSKQDVMILVKLDAKKKFINLANQIAHTNTVLIPTTMGSVALVEQAIINEAHDLGLKVPNRKQTNDRLQEESLPDGEDDDDTSGDAVAGAYVVDPKTGLHDWVGSVDINSLYPSTIRTLNMGPETLIGQLRPTLTEEHLERKVREEKMTKTEALHDMFGTLEYQEVIKRSDREITVEFDRPEKESFELTADEIYSLIFETDNGWCISANGTIFKTDQQGIIPHLLERWYHERQAMQKKSKDLFKLANGIEISSELSKKLK